mgnify:CR=1 FL=1
MPRAGETIEEWCLDNVTNSIYVKVNLIPKSVHDRVIVQEQIYGIKPNSLKKPNKKKTQLVLFHTEGEYEDDWVPMTPINGKSSCKWNGQKKHRFDYLLTDYGENVIVLARDRKAKPYKYMGQYKNIEQLDYDIPIGTAIRYKLNEHLENNYNNIAIYSLIERIDGKAWQESALFALGLIRIKGIPLSGIQLCETI